ncbi:MAG: hypothetical protein FJ271_28715 [Planctomycetes bacterium]|nr:hypothetical protein [Planctomycetota bacterium]
MQTPQRSAEQWYREATRCYLENHQGCAWCGGPHRVFCKHGDNRQVYFCHVCDFQVGLDEATGKFFTVPGEDVAAGKLTMYER